jgi:exonuclease III
MNLRAQTDSNTVIVGEINTPLSTIDRSSRQKTNKETLELIHTLDLIYIIDIYRVFHPTTMQYIFFSAAHGTFSTTDHILGHKSKFDQI